ncbi:MAG: hypothetical protein FWF96_03240, partial [Kiritimatiellaeota bacterium]|nr:hypothetical protein [Kiritimatiellota bacterium]
LPDYLGPLAGAAQNVLDEIEATRLEHARVEAALDSLGKDGKNAAAVEAAVEAVRAENAARGAVRAEEKAAAPTSPILFSGLVEARCAEMLPPLRGLVENEEKLGRKVENIAMRRDPGAEALADPRTTHARLLALRADQTARSGALDMAAKDLASKLNELDRNGFEPGRSKLSVEMGALFNPVYMAEVFAFLDEGVAKYPVLNDPAPACAYDAFVGVHHFKAFLDAAEDWTPNQAKNFYDTWTPRLVEARAQDDRFRAFLDYLGVMQDPRRQRVVVMRDILAVPGNKVVEYRDFITDTRKRLENWREETREKIGAAKGAREKILLLGMLVMMDEKPAAKDLKALRDEWSALKKALPAHDEERQLADGIPGTADFFKAWQKIRAAGEDAP